MKLRYEGEYLEGEIYGKGKEYTYNGELKYEGEFLHGKRNGNGKEYYKFEIENKISCFQKKYFNELRNRNETEYY